MSIPLTPGDCTTELGSNGRSVSYEQDAFEALYHWRKSGVKPTGARYLRWKLWFDRLLAAVMLLLCLPLIGLLVVLIRLTSRGPGLFRQVRVGYEGRLFTMYKLRTMRCDAESHTGPIWTHEDDPRITRLGKIIRRLHLDELPQLLCVARGDMALLGPRPERPEFVEVLVGKVDGYMDRLCIMPGISGLAQVNLPSDTDVEDVRRKLILDLEYVRTVGFLLDTRIGLFTILRLLGLNNRPVLRLLRLDRSELVSETSLRRVKFLTPAEIAVAAAADAGCCPRSDAGGSRESTGGLPRPRVEKRRGTTECQPLISPQRSGSDPLFELL